MQSGIAGDCDEERVDEDAFDSLTVTVPTQWKVAAGVCQNICQPMLLHHDGGRLHLEPNREVRGDKAMPQCLVTALH
eukprot:5047983-Amphidinium_carterae.1